ncbi:MAG: PDZ domain-containing protein, partial [Oscillospiraceae bacterium]|nr:PDZ domain-containing protein [Oscillospiraceae bacterium]
MSVLVSGVSKKSIADKKGIKPGDVLVSVNSHEINDVLDYRFYIKEEKLTLALVSNGKAKKVHLRKDEDDDLGLEFDSYLMDRQHRCTNRCIFCFVDQMPPGMRETLYF